MGLYVTYRPMLIPKLFVTAPSRGQLFFESLPHNRTTDTHLASQSQTSHNQSYSYFSGEAVGSGAVGGSWVELLVGLGWGVAGAILAEIIATARRAGLTALNLETGVEPYFASARRLYERHGFTIRGPFADYTDDLLSIYYGLPLTTLTPVAR